MQWLRDAAAAMADSDGGSGYRSETTIVLQDIGAATVRIQGGDVDGGGTPGLQLVIEHQFLSGPVAVAFSPRESEQLIGAIYREESKFTRWLKRRGR